MRNFSLTPIFFVELIYLLVPITLVFSKAIAEIFLLIIIVYFLINSLKKKKYEYYKNNLFIFFLIFCLYLISVSFVKNENIPNSVLFYFRFGLFSIATWFLLDNSKKLIKKIMISIFLTCSLVTIDALVQYFVGYNILGYGYLGEGSRLSGFFGDELILGSYLSRLAPIFILQLILFTKLQQNKKIFSISIFSIVLFLFSFVIFLTGERTAFLYFIFTVIFFVFLVKSKIISYYIISIVLCSFILLFLSGETRLVKTTALQLKYSIDKTDEKIKLKKLENIPIAHFHHWKSTYLMAKANPFFGVGPRMFREECKNLKYYVPGGCSSHPHNFYFQLFGEAGIFGFLFLTSFFLFTLKVIINNFKRVSSKLFENHLMISCSIFCSFLNFFPFLPNGNFFNNWINMITFFTIGIFLYANKRNAND